MPCFGLLERERRGEIYPSYYGPWSSAYSFFWRLQDANIWDEILKLVAIEPDREQVMVDATIVRVHHHGAGAKGGKMSKPSDVRAED